MQPTPAGCYGSFGIDDDSETVVDEIIGIGVERRVDALSGDPGGLRVGEGDLFCGFAATPATAFSVRMFRV